MSSFDEDPAQHILAIDPGHQVWIDGISQSCGLDKPSLNHQQPVLMDRKSTRVWMMVWLQPREYDGVGFNYGVRVDQRGLRFKCIVRGPQGHVTLDYWPTFPDPGKIVTAAMMAGFDWAPPIFGSDL